MYIYIFFAFHNVMLHGTVIIIIICCPSLQQCLSFYCKIISNHHDYIYTHTYICMYILYIYI